MTVPHRVAPSPDGATHRVHLPGPFRAVIFDLDGLLVETERLWADAKAILFERHGVPHTREDHLAVFGASEWFTARYFVGRFGLPPDAEDAIRVEYQDIAEQLFDRGVVVTPGSRELLGGLHGRVPLGLVSNTRRQLVDLILERADMSRAFDIIVTADDGTPKPAPDLYLLACRLLDVEPVDTVALEDSPTGVAAARSAGLTCIGVPSEPEARLEVADITLTSLLEVGLSG